MKHITSDISDSDFLHLIKLHGPSNLVVNPITPKQTLVEIDEVVKEYINRLKPRPIIKFDGDLIDYYSQIKGYINRQKYYLKYLVDMADRFLHSCTTYEGKKLVLCKNNNSEYFAKMYDEYPRTVVVDYFNFFYLLETLDFVPSKLDGPNLVKQLKKFKVSKLTKPEILQNYKNILKHLATYHYHYDKLWCKCKLHLLDIFQRIYKNNIHYLDVELIILSRIKLNIQWQVNNIKLLEKLIKILKK